MNAHAANPKSSEVALSEVIRLAPKSCTREVSYMERDLLKVPEGIPATTALEHASILLAGTSAALDTVINGGVEESNADHAWLLQHGVKSAKALIDAVIEGLEFPQ